MPCCIRLTGAYLFSGCVDCTPNTPAGMTLKWGKVAGDIYTLPHSHTRPGLKNLRCGSFHYLYGVDAQRVKDLAGAHTPTHKALCCVPCPRGGVFFYMILIFSPPCPFLGPIPYTG